MRLEPSREELERLGSEALEFVLDFVDRLPNAPAADVAGAADLAERLLAEAPPERGRPFGELLETFSEAAAKAYDTAGPGYLAYVPGGGLVTAALAEWLASTVNRYTGMAGPAPALVALEESVLRWLCGVFELPAGAQGIVTTGGSMANLSAVVTARSERLGEDLRDATLYVTEHAHHSVAKAALLAGLPRAAVRVVPCDESLRMDPAALDSLLASDPRPFLVVASAGTTNTGAVDPLGAIADVAAAHGCWLHVDGAYGGAFQLTGRGREVLAGVERADSVTLDPHKGLFIPYGTGCLLVRDGAALRRAHSVEAGYLQDLGHELPVPNYADISPELSRASRGVRLWLPLHLHGVAAFREALDEKLDLARAFWDALGDMPSVDRMSAPALSIVPFRLRDGGDAENRALQERINARGRHFLSSTVLDGRFTLRICVVSHRTHRDRIDELIETVRAATS